LVSYGIADYKIMRVPMEEADKSESLVPLSCCSNSDLDLVVGIRLELDIAVEEDNG
jgi:hypothetical protein